MSKRVSGELTSLIMSSKIAFKELFEQREDNTFIMKAQ